MEIFYTFNINVIIIFCIIKYILYLYNIYRQESGHLLKQRDRPASAGATSSSRGGSSAAHNHHISSSGSAGLHRSQTTASNHYHSTGNLTINTNTGNPQHGLRNNNNNNSSSASASVRTPQHHHGTSSSINSNNNLHVDIGPGNMTAVLLAASGSRNGDRMFRQHPNSSHENSPSPQRGNRASSNSRSRKYSPERQQLSSQATTTATVTSSTLPAKDTVLTITGNGLEVSNSNSHITCHSIVKY